MSNLEGDEDDETEESEVEMDKWETIRLMRGITTKLEKAHTINDRFGRFGEDNEELCEMMEKKVSEINNLHMRLKLKELVNEGLRNELKEIKKGKQVKSDPVQAVSYAGAAGDSQTV